MHPVYAILDGPVLGERGIALTAAAEFLLDGGIRLLQIRWKDNWTATVYEEALHIARLCAEADATLVINDSVDVAMLLGGARPPGPPRLDSSGRSSTQRVPARVRARRAGSPRHIVGVHVGQDDLPPARVRSMAGDLYLGRSTHNEAQFCAALAEPVDYIALGPIYGTASKTNPDPMVGAAELKRLRALSAKPVVAIGGITLERAPEAWAAGADSVAIIGDLYPPGCTPASIRRRAGEWAKAAYDHRNR